MNEEDQGSYRSVPRCLILSRKKITHLMGAVGNPWLVKVSPKRPNCIRSGRVLDLDPYLSTFK